MQLIEDANLTDQDASQVAGILAWRDLGLACCVVKKSGEAGAIGRPAIGKITTQGRRKVVSMIAVDLYEITDFRQGPNVTRE